MSIRIIKAGIADSFRDAGRYGYQHLGINPGGAMDEVAMKVANFLVGNQPNEAVLEMHFPAPEIMFEQDALIAFSGADFAATINNTVLPFHRPIIVRSGSIVKFLNPAKGAVLYCSLRGGFLLHEWLGSHSTNQQCQTGGYNGRLLKTNDVINFGQKYNYAHLLKSASFYVLPFSANVFDLYHQNSISILPGRQYHLLSKASQQQLISNAFTISNQSNRMGYRLQATPLKLTTPLSIVSSGVTKGTIQLLPNGQLTILMADHQTTGGYPVIGHVISAAFPALAQYRPAGKISFRLCTYEEAEEHLYRQQLHLNQLQNACEIELARFLKLEDQS